MTGCLTARTKPLHDGSLLSLSGQNLFPFGFSEGDLTVPRFVDGSSPRIDLSTPVPFFGTTEMAIYVSLV